MSNGPFQFTTEELNRPHGTVQHVNGEVWKWNIVTMGWDTPSGPVYPDHERIPDHVWALVHRLTSRGRRHLHLVK